MLSDGVPAQFLNTLALQGGSWRVSAVQALVSSSRAYLWGPQGRSRGQHINPRDYPIVAGLLGALPVT